MMIIHTPYIITHAILYYYFVTKLYSRCMYVSWAMTPDICIHMDYGYIYIYV